MLGLADLRTFVVVIDEASFTRAAKRLHRTQPAVSVAIRRLESATGAELFGRNRTGLVLTPAGARLETYARRMMAVDDQARTALANLRQTGRTRLVIGANDSLTGIILPFVDAFCRQRPDVRVDLKRTRSRDVAGLVSGRTLDVGVTMAKPGDVNLEAILLGHDELVVVVPSSHVFARRSCVALTDVAQQPLIAHNEPSPDRTRVLALFEAHGIPYRIALGVPTLDTLKTALETGLGITIMSRRCAWPELQGGRLVGVRLEGRPPTREMWLVAPASASRSKVAAAFVDLVVRQTRSKRMVTAAVTA